MTDQYKETYKKEMEQIHAPADLIARTRAAVRAEEARIQRERAPQTAGFTEPAAKPVMRQQAPAVQSRHSWSAAARKWAYPLSAVAAILVLVSVSMMMRGLKDSHSDSAPAYESAASDSGAEESAWEDAVAGAAPEDALLSEGTADAGAGVETASAEAAADEAFEAETGSVEAAADEAVETKKYSEDRTAGIGAASEAERAESAEEMFADSAAGDMTVKRVWRKPAFADRSEAELQIYEDKGFWVVREDEGWAAYVESGDRGGYEIRGEAESMEAFLEAAYRKLEEIGF